MGSADSLRQIFHSERKLKMNNNLTKIIDGRIQFKIGNEYKDIISYCTDTCWTQCLQKNMRTDCTCPTAYLYKAVIKLVEIEHLKIR